MKSPQTANRTAPKHTQPQSQTGKRCHYHQDEPLRLDLNEIEYCRQCRAGAKFAGISEQERRIRHGATLMGATASADEATR